MTFASADRVQLAIIPEVTFGVTPLTGSAYKQRMTGESLVFNLTKASDKELTDDAQQGSNVTINAQSTGDVKVHMQYGEYDRFFAAVMRSAWAAHGVNGVGTTFSGSITAGTLGTVASVLTAAAAPVGANAFTTLQPGQWFQLNMPGTANDKKFFRNSVSVAPTSTTVTLDVSTPAAAATAIAGTAVGSARLTNGTVLTTFSMEKQIAEVGQYLLFTGMGVSKFSTSFTASQLTEATFSFMGKSSLRTTTTSMPGAIVESQTFDIQNTVTGFGNLWEGGVPLTSTSVKTISLDIDSALRVQEALGSLGAVGLGIGTFVAKGNVTVYFANGNLYDKYANDTYTSISFYTKDRDGNGYIFTMPKVSLTGAKIVAGGRNTDLMAEFQYEALADKGNAVPALRKTLIIDRVGAAIALP